MQLKTLLEQLRHDHRAPLILSVFFSVFSLIILWNTANRFISHRAQLTAEKIHPMSAPINIADLHLFGLYTSTLSTLPNTPLQLTLQGTIIDIDVPSQSRALIATFSGPTKLYQVGDTVPGNAIITRIEQHSVILNDNSALEKLVLPIKTVGAGVEK